VPGAEDLVQPVASPVIKITCFENGKKGGPSYRVEGFTKVDFEDEGGRFAHVATANKVSRVGYVFRDATTGKEASLVVIHQGVGSPWSLVVRTFVMAFMTQFWREIGRNWDRWRAESIFGRRTKKGRLILLRSIAPS
jgi:hypothetical protein